MEQCAQERLDIDGAAVRASVLAAEKRIDIIGASRRIIKELGLWRQPDAEQAATAVAKRAVEIEETMLVRDGIKRSALHCALADPDHRTTAYVERISMVSSAAAAAAGTVIAHGCFPGTPGRFWAVRDGNGCRLLTLLASGLAPSMQLVLPGFDERRTEPEELEGPTVAEAAKGFGSDCGALEEPDGRPGQVLYKHHPGGPEAVFAVLEFREGRAVAAFHAAAATGGTARSAYLVL